MDVFIGSEPLVRAGMERGAVGAVSGLATAAERRLARSSTTTAPRRTCASPNSARGSRGSCSRLP